MKKTNVLLTGASGNVGREIVKILSKDNDVNLTLFDQDSRNVRRVLKSFRGKVIYGDLRKTEELEIATHDCDVVLHLGAVIPPLANQSIGLAKEINYEGTKNLIRLLEKNSPHCFFIYSSSVAIYGDRLASPWIRVGDELHACEDDLYGQSKILAEEAIRNSSLTWSIFRLSAIFGAGNHTLSGLLFRVPLDTPIEFTTPEDTGRAFVHAIHKREELRFKIFNLGGGPSCRFIYQDFLKTSFEIFGLGNLNFPPKAFAEKNFHCGYYADGDNLEKILKFRHHTTEHLYEMMRKKVGSLQFITTKMLRKIIKKRLLKLSEPYCAYHSGDLQQMKNFF